MIKDVVSRRWFLKVSGNSALRCVHMLLFFNITGVLKFVWTCAMKSIKHQKSHHQALFTQG